MFWVISVYFNVRNILPRSGTFLPGHPVYIRHLCTYVAYPRVQSYLISRLQVPLSAIFHTNLPVSMVCRCCCTVNHSGQQLQCQKIGTLRTDMLIKLLCWHYCIHYLIIIVIIIIGVSIIPRLINLCTNSLMDALLQAIKGIVRAERQKI